MKEISGKTLPFRGVAIAFILLGAAIISIGGISWFISFNWDLQTLNAPFEKVMGGSIITLLGYVVLELEMMRNK